MKKIIFPTRMQSLTFDAKHVIVVPNFLDEETCTRLRANLAAQHEPDFMPGADGKQVSWYDPVDAVKEQAVLLKMLAAIKKANKQNFRFDPKLFLDQTAYVNRYAGATKDFRGWHTDLSDGQAEYRLRKLTGVVQLSKSEEYVGGNLDFINYHALKEDVRQQGTLIIFPAYEWHQIATVEEGERYSLTMFVSGPPFK